MATKATRTQAKAAIDSAGTTVKADIDTILPSGVDIVDGSIRFASFKYSMTLIEVDLTAATILANTISANLTAAARVNTISFHRRKTEGGKSITVAANGATFLIQYT